MITQIILNYIAGFIIGWILEWGYRSFVAKKQVRPLLINTQIYALSTVGLYFIYVLQAHLALKVILILVLTTGIEFIIGYTYLITKKVLLWDYTEERFNFKGIICLRFSLYWLLLSLVYYYLIIPRLI